MSRARFIIGDVFDALATLPDDSVDLVFTSPPFLAVRSYLPDDHPDKAKEIGSEPDPATFVDVMIDVAEECARVLAPHGSLCFELGDTFAGSGGSGGDYAPDGWRDGQPTFTGSARAGGGWPLPKSLSMIPELVRVALAYGFNPLTGRRTDPWRIRNVVRWVRPNPPVGALGDKFRPATSDVLVACKSATRFFDLDAVRKPYKIPGHPSVGKNHQGPKADHRGNWGTFPARTENPLGAPPLDWWEISPKGYTGSHYAVFPPELVTTPVKAMSPERVCVTCGEPSRRIVDVEYVPHSPETIEAQHAMPHGQAAAGTSILGVDESFRFGRASKVVTTAGFTDCGHDNWRTGVVLDPFAGSGTTLAVATGHSRDAIGIDLDDRNADLALERVGPLFLEIERL